MYLNFIPAYNRNHLSAVFNGKFDIMWNCGCWVQSLWCVNTVYSSDSQVNL